MNKFLDVLGTIITLACIGAIIYAEYVLFTILSIGSVMVGVGILFMFGPPTLYLLMNLIASFCGKKVIGQLVNYQTFGSGGHSSDRHQFTYAFLDKNGKVRFVTAQAGNFKGHNTHTNKTILIRHIGPFASTESMDNKTEEELNQYEWSNIVMKQAELSYKKYNKKLAISIPIWFCVCTLLIIVGAFIG